MQIAHFGDSLLLSDRSSFAMCAPAPPMADHTPRRGGRVVECTALEMRHGCKPIGGSNPSLSAKSHCFY